MKTTSSFVSFQSLSALRKVFVRRTAASQAHRPSVSLCSDLSLLHSSGTGSVIRVSRSPFMPSSLLRLAATFLLIFFIGISNVLGDTTYKLTLVSSAVEAGNKYVFVQDGYAMNNSVSSSALQCTNSYKTQGLEGTESYVWTLETATGGFYMKNISKNTYLNNSSSTTVSLGTKSSIWTFSFSSNVATIQNESNSNRFLGFTSSTSHAYKAYATSNLSTYAHAITVYRLDEEVSCSSEVAVSKGTPLNGDFTLSAGNVCADSPGGEIAVSNITPSDCYEFDEIVATNGTPDNVNKKVTGITGATTITVKFRKKITNTYVDEIQDNDEQELCDTHDAPALSDKTPATEGTCAQQHWHFAGWTTETYKSNPEGHITTAGTSMTANGTTYYAVWSKGNDNSTSKTYTLSLSNSDAPSSYSGTWSSKNATEDGGTGTFSVSFSGSNVMNQDSKIQFKKSSGYFYNTTDLGTINSISITTNSSIKYYIGSTSNPSNSGSGGYFKIYNSTSNAQTATSITINFTKTTGSVIFSDYITTCCTPLDAINGSIECTSGTTATLSWNAVDGAESYKVKVPGSSTHNDWTTATSPVPVTGLTAGQNYTAYFKALDTNGSHCSDGPESTKTFTTPKITVTGSLNTFAYIYGNGPSEEKEFTVSGVGLTGDITVSAPTNYEVSKTSGSDYGNSVSFSPTSGTLASSTVYVRLKSGLAVGSCGPSDITVSGGSAASVNVAVSGTVSPACETPTINTQPTGATYNLNATAAALSVSATKNGTGPDLTYQWYSNTTNNNTTGTPISGATNSTYTPATTETGTTYYYCVVSSGACSSTTNAAAVIISTPAITVSSASIAFGERAVDATTGYTETFTVSGNNLAKDQGLTLAVTGANAAMFTLSSNTVAMTEQGTVSSTEITVTYKPSTAGTHSATLTVSSTGAADRTIALSGTGKWGVTWMLGTSEHATTLATNGTKPTLPSVPANNALGGCANTFVGWSATPALTGTGNTAPDDLFTSAAGAPDITANTTFRAVYATGAGDITSVTDELTRATTEITNGTTSYSTWSNKTGTSGAVYAGQSAGGNNAIQLRSNNSNSGIITTTSGGTATKVAVVWNSNTSNDRTIDIYGKNTAYSAATDLYNNSNQGSLLGTIVYGTSTELDITGDYEYIGIRSHDGALYLDQLNITWTSDGTTYSDYVTMCCDLKPVTNLEVSGTTANSVTLTWTAPSPATGIDHLELRNASTNAKVGGNVAVGTTTVTVSELVECTEYTYYIASVGAACETVSATVNARPYSGSKTVNYIYHDGATANSQFTTDCDNPTITLPAPTWALHTFMGWYDAATGGSKAGDGGATYNPATSPVTLHAQWTETNFVLTQTIGSHTTAGNAAANIKTSDIASSDLVLTYSISDNGYALPKTVTVSGGGIATWELGTNYTWSLSADKHTATLTILQGQTISADVTVNIAEQARYTVTLNEHGSTTTQYYAADDNLFTWDDIADCGTKKFYGWTADGEWTASDDESGLPASCVRTKGTETMNSTRTYYAIYADAVVPQNPGYVKVTTISAGTYLIAGTTSYNNCSSCDSYAYAGQNGTGNSATGNITSVTISDGIISAQGSAVEVAVSLGTGGDAGYFAIRTGNTYMKGYSGNNLVVQDDIIYDWSLTAEGYIQSKSQPTRYIELRKASTIDRICTYAGTQDKCFLFKKQTTTYSNFATSCALHNIAIDGDITGGTVTTSPTAGTDAAGAGQEVTVNVTPDACKYLSALEYNDGSDDYDIDISSTPYTFTMPEANVTVTATFSDKSVTSIAPATNTNRILMQGTSFVGERIRVTYNNGETEDLEWDNAALSWTGDNTSTLGTHTVTIELDDDCVVPTATHSTSYTVEITDGVPVTYYDGNNSFVRKYELNEIVGVDTISGKIGCGGYTFVGWSETAISTTDDEYVPVHNFAATTARTLYAVYALQKKQGWMSIENATCVKSGAEYLYVKVRYSDSFAMSNTASSANSNYLAATLVTSSISTWRRSSDNKDFQTYSGTPAAALKWQVIKSSDDYYLYNADAAKYLKVTSSAIQLTATPEDNLNFITGGNDCEVSIQSSNSSYYASGYYTNPNYYFKPFENTTTGHYLITRDSLFTTMPPCVPRSVTFYGNGGIVSDGVNEGGTLVITEANRDDGITTPTAAMDMADCNGNTWEFLGWLNRELAKTRIPVLTTDLLNDGRGNKHYDIMDDDEEYYAVYYSTDKPETKYGTITLTKDDIGQNYFNSERTTTKTVASMGDYTFGYVDLGHQSSIGMQFESGLGELYNKTSLGKINSISFTNFTAGGVSNLLVYVGDEEKATTHLLEAGEMQHIDGSNTWTYYPSDNYSYLYIKDNSGYVNVQSISIDFGNGSTIYATTPDCTLRVTYKAAGEEDHVVEIGDGNSHNLPAYYPAGCDDKEFIGWAEAGISALQQTAPTIYTADGSLTGVSAPKTLYAVYASRNGGKVTGSHTLTEDFESYTTSTTYGNTGVTFNNANGLSWVIDYGNVTGTTASTFGGSNSKHVILYPNAAQGSGINNVLKMSSGVNDVIGVSLYAFKNAGSITGKLYWSGNGTSWTEENSVSLSLLKNNTPYQTSKTFNTVQQTLWMKITAYEPGLTNGHYLYLNDIVFTIADREYYYTDYSTTCEKASAPVALTWAGIDGSTIETGTEPENVSLGTWLTLPVLSKDNYRFDGWKVTINGKQKADVYLGGETFLINHPVTFTAQWTQVFGSVVVPQNMPVVAANGVGVKSSVTGKVVINRAGATKPAAVLTGADAAMFTAVTIADGVTEGETTVFTYSVTYTPSAANTFNEVQLAFRDGDGTGATTGVTSSNLTLSGRSLPEQFVITAQVNGVYLGLPENTTNSAQLMPYAVTDVADGTAFNVENTMKYHVTGSIDSILLISSNTGDDANHKFAGFKSGLRSANSQTGVHYNWYVTYSDGKYRLCNTGVTDDDAVWALTYNTTSEKFNMIKTSTAGTNYHRDLYLLPIMEETGYWLDIVDWNISSLTINMNGRKLTNGVDAKVGEGEMQTLTPNTRYSWTGNPDRTYDVQIGAPAAGSYVRLHVEWGTKTGADVSERLYRMPYIYTGNTTLSDAGAITAADNIVVRSGRLTVNADVAVRNVYVYPGAELVIASNRKLKAEKMYLRTEPFRTAALDDRGTLDVGQLYYTRIVADKDHAFMFGLPYDSKIEDMRLTTGQTMAYGTKWLLYTYNAARRAENGASASGENWQAVSETVTNIEAKKAYDLLSGSAYYREYCFPVNYVKREDGQTIEITDYTGTAATANPIHGGWNHFCSPYTRNYVQDFSGSPEEAVKLTELTEDKVTYWQHVPEVINPAIAYFYQTSANGTLTFGSSMLTFAGVSNIAARSHEQKVNTQWLVLNLTDKAGLTDETNFYLHPTKFNINYEIKYDLEKMLGYAARPQLFSMMSCGALSFNALPDSIAEEGVQLGYYAAAEGEYTFSLADNKYMDRLQEVWLVDGDNGTLTDLRSADYTFTTTAGDNRTRFRLFVTFRREEPQTPTGDMQLQDGENNNNTRKFVYKNRLFILRDGRLYDVLGNGVRE